MGRYDHIDFYPPNGVQAAAERGLILRAEYGRGGTAVGLARGRQLSSGQVVSPRTAKRMLAYFTRHARDLGAEGAQRGERGYPSAGLIAWLLWGGDPGYRWASKIVEQMRRADEE